MKPIKLMFFISLFLLAFSHPLFALKNDTPSIICNKTTIPTAIKRIENYDIVAYNSADITTDFAFSGDKLVFSVKANPQNKKNIVTINRHTGKISIQAEAQDNFDIKVIATNICGQAFIKFNIQIDEDKG